MLRSVGGVELLCVIIEPDFKLLLRLQLCPCLGQQVQYWDRNVMGCPMLMSVGPSDLSAVSAAAMTPVAASPAVRLLWRRRCALRGGISFGGMVWCDRWRGGDGGGVACVALVSVVLGAEVESVVC